MAETISVDMLAFDPQNDEFVLYFVEEGPWPENESKERQYLDDLQERLLSAVDAIIDGGVAAKFPDSAGRRFRIDVFSPDGAPDMVLELVEAVDRYVRETAEYADALHDSDHASSLRIVTSAETDPSGRTDDRA